MFSHQRCLPTLKKNCLVLFLDQMSRFDVDSILNVGFTLKIRARDFLKKNKKKKPKLEIYLATNQAKNNATIKLFTSLNRLISHFVF